MDEQQSAQLPERTGSQPKGLSYKFQRLREQIRAAVASGELAGKLPGERALARRFRVNAKTLSKALTDLAAEGVLDRSIGRGTFVKGSAPADAHEDRWLVLCDPRDGNSALVNELMRLRPQSRPVAGTTELRPSFLAQFTAVVDCAHDTPDRFRRDMIVRGVPVVVTTDVGGTYSTHAVRMDKALAAFSLGRDLLLAGHRHLGALDAPGSTAVGEALRSAAARYAPEAVVETGTAADVVALVEHGVTGLVCDGRQTALAVVQALAGRAQVPGQVSVAAVGDADGDPPCSGYYVDPTEKAEAITALVRDLQAHRPCVLWLSGRAVDRGTIAPPQGQAESTLKLPKALAS